MSSLVRLAPRQPGEEWDESHGTKIFSRKPVIVTADTQQLLITVILAHWRNQDPAPREPINERRRQLRGRSGNDHTVVGRLLGPTLRPIAESADNIAQPQVIKPALGLAQQLALPFDRKDPTAETREHRSLVARTGTDLE